MASDQAKAGPRPKPGQLSEVPVWTLLQYTGSSKIKRRKKKRSKRKDLIIFCREISKADYLLDVIEREVAEAIVLADLEHKGGGGAVAFVLLRDALARLKECRALPNVQALPDRPPYKKRVRKEEKRDG